MAGGEIKRTIIPTDQPERWGQRLRRGLRHVLDFRNPHIPADDVLFYEEAVRRSGGRFTEIVDRGEEVTIYVRPYKQRRGMRDIDDIFMPVVRERALKTRALVTAF